MDEEITGLCFDCPEDGDLHIPSQPTCSRFYLQVEVPGQTLLRMCYWAAMLVLPEGTTFYFINKTTSPLRKLFGNKLQECVAASSAQALIHLLPTSSKSFEKQLLVQKLCLLNLMKQKVLAKQTGSFRIKFDKNAILKYICHSTFGLLFCR